MTNNNITLDIPTRITPEEVSRVRTIKWCEGHWAELMFALKDRGLGDQIAGSPEELNEKLIQGAGDPCWDACNMINMGAMDIFGVDKIIGENNGCPVCTFANMVQHAADIVAQKFGSIH